MLSATVVGKAGMQTDALSTAYYVMGTERVRAYCHKHPEAQAVLVTASEGGEPRVERVGNWD